MRYQELILYRNFEDETLLRKMTEVMDRSDMELTDSVLDPGSEKVACEIYECIALLLKEASDHGFYGNLWHDYLTNLLVSHENSYSMACEMRGNVEGSINEAALHDMEIFKEYFDFDFTKLERGFHIPALSMIMDWKPSGQESKIYNRRIRDRICVLASEFEKASSASQMKDLLTQFYKEYGVGDLGLHKAFRVEHDDVGMYAGMTRIVPVRNMMHVELQDLIGYEVAKKKLVDNTEAFVSGRPANNCLLYGEAGTGKSSSIKAIANEYYDRGLRVIQVTRYQFRDLNQIISRIKNRNYRFILYMDDLSFEESETEYKYLKAVIEGGLEEKPSNILIYATSNRRHLVKESFHDRDSAASDDKHGNDTVQEKLSLAYRFGVTIYFGAPSFEEYQQIVKGLAERNGIQMEERELQREATEWEMKHGGLSGRTAQQFIDYLLGTKMQETAAGEK